MNQPVLAASGGNNYERAQRILMELAMLVEQSALVCQQTADRHSAKSAKANEVIGGLQEVEVVMSVQRNVGHIAEAYGRRARAAAHRSTQAKAIADETTALKRLHLALMGRLNTAVVNAGVPMPKRSFLGAPR
ncbi:hypothetical protein ACIO6T_37990 [Streptomyces sp. NPDC087532]|uniref:hypothetical protein n=1 Tax=Streptomyces sp. NPDC087532 TaxID=3365795 RepID=UPI003829D8D6